MGKNERLRSRKLIGMVFSEGKKMSAGSLRVNYLLGTNDASNKNNLRTGIGVSTKNFSKATDRNRIKRLLRESWRLEKNSLAESIPAQKYLDVFIIYTGDALPTLQMITGDIKKLVFKLIGIVAGNK